MTRTETGPIYNVPLIDTLPLGSSGGVVQQMPSRDDLVTAKVRFERVCAGYEVLLAHYQRAMERAATLESVARAFVEYYPVGINPDLDAAYVLARKCITNGDVT